MSKTVEIEALRPFHKTAQGELAEVGERFSVDETRAQELARNGLAKPVVKPKGKAAPSPENKMAAEPENKGEKPNRYARLGFASRSRAAGKD